MVKNGKTRYGKQRYLCKNCGKTQVENYTYHAWKRETNRQIITLTKEGLGIRSTARVLRISPTTLLKRILSIAKNIPKPFVPKGKSYEVDEIRSFIKSKNRLIWIVYALEKESKNVANFCVGARTNKTLNHVLTTLHLSDAQSIYTDKLRNYTYLIDKKIHKTKNFGTNHIERNHLTLRTHLKRLNRKTICFSRSLLILSSILKIYFWS